MLQLITLMPAAIDGEVLFDEYKTIVSFVTTTNIRVDISKKFVKFDKKTNQWYFTKSVYKHKHGYIDVTTFIKPNVLYIVEINDNVMKTQIDMVVKDLMSVEEIDRARGLISYAEESYRS